MDSDTPEDRPESPKKKIRPSSTTNSDPLQSDSQNATDVAGTSSRHNSGINGVAPTRRRQELGVSSSSERSNVNPLGIDVTTIQEEVVSSSENMVHGKKELPSYSEGDADSLTNEAEDLSSGDREVPFIPQDSEAERKEL